MEALLGHRTPPVVQAFLNGSSVKAALNQTSSALAAITVLKKICVHPALLTDRAASQAVRGGKPRCPLTWPRPCCRAPEALGLCPPSALSSVGRPGGMFSLGPAGCCLPEDDRACAGQLGERQQDPAGWQGRHMSPDSEQGDPSHSLLLRW